MQAQVQTPTDTQNFNTSDVFQWTYIHTYQDTEWPVFEGLRVASWVEPGVRSSTSHGLQSLDFQNDGEHHTRYPDTHSLPLCLCPASTIVLWYKLQEVLTKYVQALKKDVTHATHVLNQTDVKPSRQTGFVMPLISFGVRETTTHCATFPLEISATTVFSAILAISRCCSLPVRSFWHRDSTISTTLPSWTFFTNGAKLHARDVRIGKQLRWSWETDVWSHTLKSITSLDVFARNHTVTCLLGPLSFSGLVLF